MIAVRVLNCKREQMQSNILHGILKSFLKHMADAVVLHVGVHLVIK